MFQKIINKAFNFALKEYRGVSTNAVRVKLREQNKANAWQVHSYGDISELQFGKIRIPQIRHSDEVLINVEAASLNPIDNLMLGGYGRTLFQIPRKFEMELPLVLGRDFCGTVIYKGLEVGSSFSVGDKVYGFIPIHKQGTFSEVVVANKAHICKKPKDLTEAESASLVYATMTAWSALYLFGNLLVKGARGSRVLILGASGGVGTAAVQLLKSQGSIVYGTCSTDAMPLVRSLGADCIFDYKDSDYLKNVETGGFYHIILDCAKFGYENIPKTWKFGTYITLNSPLLLNTDKYGLVGGLLNSAATFLSNNIKPPGEKRCLMWGFFVPSGSGFQFINKLITDGQITPLIHKQFKFENLPEAFQELNKGHLRGKIVVTL
ncbi:reticulon-4-interacting protein 1, mitochondrial [Tribolium castaneum]|uniref:Reticulon-4-interacting protein 1, mitochondrial-like Protein n=1 Tax=Tribolium castaneum TaxID=7070 RepID=D6WNV5_TRICA|nr:PREDICTED: reticulon-4-interacting protein 1, mitochondrial [Tribolium castaneum]EFA04391.1 Reticulon-4-interacting protein 1, mitochondrial-like Protein [Tribolium castaneum]|eukprot:XP_008194342.1 PREDICTED: reticulon-4-interacting protein 1, mitochondrial [Tribolium castaneum]